MRDAEEFSKTVLSLTDLLRDMAQLDIRAEISRRVSRMDGEARWHVQLSGSDTAVLTAENGRVLDAIETLAFDMLGLAETERESVQFDAGGFLDAQKVRLRRLTRAAAERVLSSGTPHVFSPMSDRELRLLESELRSSGLDYKTLGEEAIRWVILFPKEVAARAEAREAQHTSGD